jgi:hypothetical protein
MYYSFYHIFRLALVIYFISVFRRLIKHFELNDKDDQTIFRKTRTDQPIINIQTKNKPKPEKSKSRHRTKEFNLSTSNLSKNRVRKFGFFGIAKC